MPLSPPTSFHSLPFEIRLKIYDLSLPPSRLSTRPILDPEWLFLPHASRGTHTAPLLFTSKLIHAEATPLFYARATLEIAPCQRSPADVQDLTTYMARYVEDHAFCPARYLRCVRSVHVYADQEWVVERDAVWAMFRWLASRTGVEGVYMSRKVMQQGRHLGEMVCLNGLRCDEIGKGERRVVDLYARSVSGRLSFFGNALVNRVKPLPCVQLYRVVGGEEGVVLWREPRWDLLGVNVDANGVMSATELLEKEVERFAREDLGDVSMRQAHRDGYLYLYKTIWIQGENLGGSDREWLSSDDIQSVPALGGNQSSPKDLMNLAINERP